jgi:(4-(4-[2-(gamma-L-glutamylamino)ethyl]phenoxymethyl)furan-2-yl)methanamine synthase
MSWLGFDIGGANLKAADGQGWALNIPFPLWREASRLSVALTALLDAAPASDRMAVTMTGELCDCFPTKADGVLQILDAVEQAAGMRHVVVYLVDGRLVSLDDARQSPQLAAASNWHVLARFACRFLEGDSGLLIDVGSTTADIVPLIAGQPCPQGLDDSDRLLTGELVYSGVLRTPICALTTWLPWRSRRCPVAAELFATTADAYVVLGDLPEQPDCTFTADGRPLTKVFARDRLARMICADRTAFTIEDAWNAAGRVREAQSDQLRAAAQRVAASMPCKPESLFASGAGEFLAAKVGRETSSGMRIASLSERIGGSASLCGPAHALAVLARENGQNF